MRTRRQYLAGFGAASIVGLAGCSSLGGSGEEEPERLEEADLEGWSPAELVIPTGLPYSPPDSIREQHESRAIELLEAVPPDPDIPNEVIKNSVVEERSSAKTRLAEGSDLEQPLGVLREWRGIRGDAANAYGTYRAAAGIDDASSVENRRPIIRDAWATLKSDLTYEATSIIEAVVVYAPIEGLLEDAIRQIQPRQEFPTPPTKDPERAGEIMESIEQAMAAIEDANGLISAYQENRDDPDPQWQPLAQSIRRIEPSVDRTMSERIPRPETAEPEEIFDFELEGVSRELYREARRSVGMFGNRVRDHREDGRLGSAVIVAGKTVSSIAVFEAVIDAISGGDLPDEQTPETIKTAAQEASDSIQQVPTAEYPYLSASLIGPAASTYGTGTRSSDGYFDPIRAESSFRFAALYASAATEAASYLADQLDA